MDNIQRAFAYLLNLLDGVYGDGWDIADAYADTAIEFSLDDKEAQKLEQLDRSFQIVNMYIYEHRKLLNAYKS